MADKKEPAPDVISQPPEGDMSEAEIDRNLADTFPASDPPSWTLGIDQQHDSPGQPADKSGEED
jgi:hypothetical protein